MEPQLRKRIGVTGVVQGVGFRPFVWQRARQFRLCGWVRNHSAGVTIEVQGSAGAVREFQDSLHSQLPPQARIEALHDETIALADDRDFVILDSSARRGQSTPISPDIATCDDCLRELWDRSDRRFRYPFINCTHCGPRFTIVRDVPYDRGTTTMRAFFMCAACRQEYDSPADRRFHAQPNACPVCGPQLWYVSANDAAIHFDSSSPDTTPRAEAAVEAFHRAIGRGEIVAVKGIGGFHLACDATNAAAIATLRQRKGRVLKPFAIMARDLLTSESLAFINDREKRLLESSERPIVLLRKRNHTTLAAGIAPGTDSIGIMLPYSPLHHLLLDEGPPLVLTSGNVSDEPIVRENSAAQRRLKSLADGFLLHDREIHTICDDSIVRCVDHDVLPLRRSRGYAPLPVNLGKSGPSVLAIGGELKATFCATKDHYAYMSQHLGDMGNLETLEALRRGVEHFLCLFRIAPEAIVADLHPAYLSTAWATQFSHAQGIPLFQVQHHHAHLAALIAEHGLPSGESLIGVCFDGTGYGTDGAIWGGEFLLASGQDFQRFAHLKYSPLPGGDASIRRPYRVALAQLYAAGLEWHSGLRCVRACSAAERHLLRQQLESNLCCVPSSSMGRLFDAVAALVGLSPTVSFEAQAAVELETLAAHSLADAARGDAPADPRRYRFLVSDRSPREIDPAELLGNVAEDMLVGIAPQRIADRFHRAVAQLVVDICLLARREHGLGKVGLSGGVFQNTVLLQLACAQLQRAGFDVFCHHLVPPNDAGLALGQALIARESPRYLGRP
ncbi:MAG: carbamoyltransferase HypF [Planctomycetales bacterium]|nr:carbamoyltransferase HypF [Planctomycetales bacterium]